MFDIEDVTINAPEWDDSDLNIRAFWRQEHDIGFADCMLMTDNSVKLVDIKVSSAYPIPRTRLERLLRRPGNEIDFRGRGIGSQLLKLVISESKKVGADKIWGSVVESDLQQNGDLLGWYQRHGFQVLEPDGRDRNVTQAVKMVVLSL